MSQLGFTLNANLCTGCNACEIACSIENELAPGFSWRDVSTYNPSNISGANHYHLSMACNHCSNPICEEQCPAQAITKNSETGIVEIIEDNCIGCKFCSWVCPYDAPKYDTANLVMTKCNFCSPRLENNLEPACISVCPTGALTFGETKLEKSELDFLNTKLEPAYNFVPRDNKQELPKHSAVYDKSFEKLYSKKTNSSKIELIKEWPLIIFTFIVALMGGLFTTDILGNSLVNPAFIILAGIIGMEISTSHLGKRSKAYRAILNWKTSWLSREVIAFSGFMMLLAAYIVLDKNLIIGWSSAAFALLTSISIDMVYVVAAKVKNKNIHSAQITITLFLFAALFNNMIEYYIIFLSVKFILYVNRKLIKGFTVKEYIVSTVRIFTGFLLPVYLLISKEPLIVIYISTIFSELIDRIEFYYELKITDPQKELDRLLRNS